MKTEKIVTVSENSYLLTNQAGQLVKAANSFGSKISIAYDEYRLKKYYAGTQIFLGCFNTIVKIIYLEYLFCGITMLVFNKLFKLKASGHACGVIGPMLIIVDLIF